MSPEYFHRHLTFGEAQDYLDGLNRRYHTSWECARWETTFIAKCAGNKSYRPPNFGWEKGGGASYHDEDQMTLDDLRRLKQVSKAAIERMNGQKEAES